MFQNHFGERLLATFPDTSAIFTVSVNLFLTLQRKCSFPLNVSSVNVTKSAISSVTTFHKEKSAVNT